MDTNPTQEVAPLDGLLALLDSDPKEEKPEAAQTEDEAKAEPEESTDEAETDESTEAESDTDQPATDEEEVELDGEKFKVPKKLGDRLRMAEDYTKKSQANAETYRQNEDKRQFLEAHEHLISAALPKVAEIQGLQARLKQFSEVDWSALIEQDPQQAMRLSHARQQAQEALTRATHEVQGIDQHLKQAREQHKAQQFELGQKELHRRVGQIKESDRASMMSAAEELGYTPADMENPRALHALYLVAKAKAFQPAKKAEPKPMQKVVDVPRAIKPQAPLPKRENQSALDRLKSTGRPMELMKFL